MSSKRIGMEVSEAIAHAVKLADVDVVAAYPITPQTHIVEAIADLVANQEFDAEYICVESEHSAMSACLGSSAAGARTFTATAGQGLELMHEVVYVASSMRLPIVMAVANRALSAPLSVWGDHSDAMAVRDTGWIQVFCESGQDAVDMTLWAFKIAEDTKVLFPVMIHLDGFHLTHVVEPIEMPSQEEVKKYLPPNKYPQPLSPEKPRTAGSFAPPSIYTEIKKAQVAAFEELASLIPKSFDDFYSHFGRKYTAVEKYKTEGADTIMLMMGSYAQTASLAVDELRSKGKTVGLVKLRLWRPFPFDELRAAVRGATKLIIFDRAVSVGGPGGPLASEVRAALYDVPNKPAVLGFIGGLGGRDMLPEHFVELFEKGFLMTEQNQEKFEMYGVRGNGSKV